MATYETLLDIRKEQRSIVDTGAEQSSFILRFWSTPSANGVRTVLLRGDRRRFVTVAINHKYNCKEWIPTSTICESFLTLFIV